MTIDEAIEQFKYDAECNRADLDLSFAEDNDKVAEWLEELKQYRAIGTPKECREAVEKQKAKKIVRVKLRQSEWGSEYRCPVCESDLIKTVFFNEDGTEPDEKISWCSGCGQKLDWRDEE